MAAHHRPLATSAVAGGLLFALWFVPSANATYESGKPAAPTTADAPAKAESSAAGGASDDRAADSPVGQDPAVDGPLLADTGSFDSTPYVAGGLAFLVFGAGLVAHSVRRSRAEATPGGGSAGLSPTSFS
ncbi:hypothetical protein [Streptomyces alkaliterrae]|uniref:LPXTG cell wall anchor domain-containing protein n=1 Tax=Streptomyces alkaliterrae TaxID=2213162 RepID=A0A5P0YT19_9ACTN|nr:hypothetical protein [Streptomyces alkaliterrae]MBB1256684.1 hypothetical protein [Streptomyces alkaliterrae]MBB1258956.1 hypothetical protein [Streptomyces alkaliterrae]MQS03464.1 hypothetical protein [Streptomyces alkaliterrae]